MDTCGTCPDVLVNRPTWDGWTKAQRRAARGQGKARLHARGLCARCYSAARATGTLIDHERVTMPLSWRLEDLETIRDELPVGASQRRRVQVAAERLGWNPDSLRTTLRRAGVAA